MMGRFLYDYIYQRSLFVEQFSLYDFTVLAYSLESDPDEYSVCL